MELKSRVALVTGGATGIGQATVLALAKAGVSGVAINYRTAGDEAERLAAEVRKIGSEAVCLRADVKNEGEVRWMIAEIGQRFERLDILVNNAGVTHWVAVNDLEGLTDSMWDDILDVNLKGAFRCTRAASSLLSKARGMVIN